MRVGVSAKSAHMQFSGGLLAYTIMARVNRREGGAPSKVGLWAGAAMWPRPRSLWLAAVAASLSTAAAQSDWSSINASGDFRSTKNLTTMCPLIGQVAALNSPCKCSCGNTTGGSWQGSEEESENPCQEESERMKNRTGYSCGQVASGSVKNLACNQLVRDITAEEAHKLWLDGTIDLIVDVRSPSEYASLGNSSRQDKCGHSYTDKWDGCEIGHIPGSFLVPLSPWDASSLSPCKNMTLATTCYNHASHPNSTWRSNTAAALLEAAGFACVFNIVDGTKGWKERGFPVSNGATQRPLAAAAIFTFLYCTQLISWVRCLRRSLASQARVMCRPRVPAGGTAVQSSWWV